MGDHPTDWIIGTGNATGTDAEKLHFFCTLRNRNGTAQSQYDSYR
jgi:hypothetical protein